jgi:predicted dehydrogenase
MSAGTSDLSDPVRIGIVGCGRIALRGYVPAAARLVGVEVVAVADPDRERARAVAVLTGATTFDDVERLLAAPGLDGIVVASPAVTHAAIAALAAEAGLPSLVEKPPAPDGAGCATLATLEPAPSIGFNRRFLQGAALKPLVPDEGWLELELELRFQRAGWEAHVCRDEALLDAGIHLIDLASFLTGSAPIAVRDAAIAPERASLEVELGRARARIRCATDRPYAERVEVRDRAGRIVAADRIDRFRAAAGRLRGGEDRLVLSLRRQLERFAARLRGEDPGELAAAAAAVTAIGAVEAARRSAELGGAEVTVAQPELVR